MHIGLARARSAYSKASCGGRLPKPSDSRFRHQVYTDAPPASPCVRLKPTPGPALGSGESRFRLRQAGEILRAADVGAIYLVPGTFAAHDTLAVLAELSRQYPEGRQVIGQLASQMIEYAAGDAGRFNVRYADALETLLAAGGEPIPLRMLEWSCENHHLGRADAAVRLIDELSSLDLPPHKRVLLWGHGHAGNAFAIASTLLSGGASAAREFFDAAAIYYRLPMTGVVDVPIWQRVRRLLCDDRRRLAERPLDFVTFGTPIRYGWRLRADDRLLHFVNHRPLNGLPPHRTIFPPPLNDLLQAAGGDYLQQLGIAGSDSPPSRLAWRAWLADRKLGELFERDLAAGSLVERLKLGMRAAESGPTLLVDYGPPTGDLAARLAGHSVYVRNEWLLFHIEETVQRLYQPVACGARAA